MPTIPDPATLKSMAAANHFAVSSADEDVFRELFKHILPNYDGLAASLGSQREPTPDEAVVIQASVSGDPLNALVRRCHVRGSAAGSLTGKRFAIKDNVCVAGVPLTCGSAVVAHVPERSATIVDRILAAGADIVAIANMDNMAFSGAGNTSAFGPTLNPHDRTRLAGGSSGGSAAALFYDDIDLAIGGDQAGSIRIPASWCGVVGLKPTYGLVPYTGILGYDASFDHTGPMARTVADVALALDVLAGQDPDDPRQAAGVAVQEYLKALDRPDLSGLRIGIVKEGFGLPGGEPDVDASVLAAARSLVVLGAEVNEVSIAAHATAAPIIWGVFAEGVASTFQANSQGHHWQGRYDPALAGAFGRSLRENGDRLPLQCKFNLLLGTYMRQAHDGRYYAAAQNARRGLRAAYDAALVSHDVLVMPTTPMKAHRAEASLGPADLVLTGWNMVANTAPFNMTGHPSVSVPCASSDGLPVGMMITGRHFDDATVLTVAHQLQLSQLPR